MKKRLTLILPVFKTYSTNIDDTCLIFPEIKRIPAEQVSIIKQWCGRNRNADAITIITTSGYIIQGALTFLFDFFKEDEIVYNDGKNNITRNEFWRHLTQPMNEIYN